MQFDFELENRIWRQHIWLFILDGNGAFWCILERV